MQANLGTILEESSQAHAKAILRYGKANRKTYLRAARSMAKSLDGDDRDTLVRLRVAFAILSANCPFQSSVDALHYVSQVGLANVEESELARFQCVPVKAKACRLLADRPLAELLRGRGESWQAYRERLAKTTLGLGRAKASFAACLLYPTKADIACVDTWLCKVYLGHDSFKALSRRDYESVEAQIRIVRDKLDLPSTFLAQWIIWDHARGGKVNEHAIFPGQHKNLEPIPF